MKYYEEVLCEKTKLNDLAELTREEWTFSREGATGDFFKCFG